MFTITGKVGDDEVSFEADALQLTIMQREGKRKVISCVLFGGTREKLTVLQVRDESNQTVLIRVTERGFR